MLKRSNHCLKKVCLIVFSCILKSGRWRLPSQNMALVASLSGQVAVVFSLWKWSIVATSIFNLWTPECASPPPYWLLSWLEEIENILRSEKKRKCALKIFETGANLDKAVYKHCRNGKEEKQATRRRPEGACAWTANGTEEPRLSRRCSWRWRRRCWAG